MRSLAQSIVVVVLALAVPRTTYAQQPPVRTAPRDLARAQALDKEGARAYSDGRFNDAIRYFEEAHRLGGPPFELWNIARCHLRLDQPEQAAEMLERYLATPNLPPEDQKEAMQQLEELRKRQSTLTISSEPTGADVAIDGRTPEEGHGRTPVSVNVTPGSHTVAVSFRNGAKYTRQVEARYGRAIIVDATPQTTPPEEKPIAPAAPPGADTPPKVDEDYGRERPIAFRAAIGPVIPRHGGVGGDVAFGFLGAGSYRFATAGRAAFHVGGLFTINGDSWGRVANAVVPPPSCQGRALVNPTSATALSILATGAASVEIVPRLRASGLFGAGVGVYSVDDVGGDVFINSCTTEPGARPTFLIGAQLDYAVTPAFRLTAFPLALQLHPAFSGVRESASGVWLRTMIAFGAGVDF